MIDEVRRLLAENPFQPFTIVSTSGIKYRIASRDHASFSPSKNRMVIWFDEGGSVLIASLHIAATEAEASAEHDA